MILYETLFVVHPEKGPRNKEFIERFKKVIEGQEGTVTAVDEWGARDLAYRIEKQGRGFYTLIRYQATGKAVDELERNIRLTDGILRYLTVRADETTPTVSPSTPRYVEDPRRNEDPRRHTEEAAVAKPAEPPAE
ncbi:MAG: 30S ribosomal protein S6 [Deltaproteobacteria bacterium]|nr:30S ribosomal protein S6 [Deltaproteobacteria bacterium]